MKSTFLAVLALLMLLLAGCQAAGRADTTASTQPSASTAAATETTVPTTTAPEDPTQPTQTESDPFASPPEHLYWMQPDHIYCFRFTGEAPQSLPELDVSNCEYGSVYIYDGSQGSLHFLATDLSPLFTTKEHIYYVCTDDYGKLYRTDFSDFSTELVCELDGRIFDISYWGADAQGKVILLEDQKRVWMYDIATEEFTLLQEQYYIDGIGYDFATIYKNDATGYALYWRGKLSEDAQYAVYIYFLDTGLNWEPTWH